jgi:hypothetical protein
MRFLILANVLLTRTRSPRLWVWPDGVDTVTIAELIWVRTLWLRVFNRS